MEKCEWRCDHWQCTKRCYEKCDRELCKHPNTTLLEKCGHQSIGVCGEESLQLCRICDKNIVQDIFFGTEEENDARFIQLEDCKHILEVTGLIDWMNAKSESISDINGDNTNDRNSIQFKKCPKCNTIIRRTQSMNTYIQASLQDIHQVKLKTGGSAEENENAQRTLNETIKRILKYDSFNNDPLNLRGIYANLLNETELKGPKSQQKSNQILIEIKNKFDLVDKLRMICIEYEGRKKEQTNISTEFIDKFENRLRMAGAFIVKFKNCEQQRGDISTEITFLELMAEAIADGSFRIFDKNGEGVAKLNNAFKAACKHGPATEIIRNEFLDYVKEAAKNSVGMGITFQEKKMVLKAMGFSRGRWYKCQNGHIYAIGDCGGAMEESKCPECKLAIGGDDHRLVSGNAVATEMDGATDPAWPQ